MQYYNTKIVIVDNAGSNLNPFANISATDILVRRITGRYGKKGTWHNNRGYVQVGRSPCNGQFVSVK